MTTLFEEFPFFSLAALLIIAVLAVIAGRLLWQLRQRGRQQAQASAAASAQRSEQSLAARDSIRILAGCYLQGQVDAAEVSLRIAGLLPEAALDSSAQTQAAVFAEMAAALAHIPTHDLWRQLDADQRGQYQEEIRELSARYGPRLQSAATVLADSI